MNHFHLPSLVNSEDKTSFLANCIRNNYRHIKKWAKKNSTNCFRIYDREIQQFPIAIDFYAGRFCVHYYASLKNGKSPSAILREETFKALKLLFGPAIKESDLYWRIRAREKETRQYEKIQELNHFFSVQEHGHHFWVNLQDYLDTGLFLDHRQTRKYVTSICKNKSVLNLFAYTCSFSVQAALAGAKSTTSVDLSRTYLQWGKDNFLLNHLHLNNHRFIREDCLKFLDHEFFAGPRYDLIIVDPPTISRSKKMSQLFDVQKDYLSLLQKALKLLNKQGVIIFSTNSRKFKFDPSFLENNVDFKEITHLTIPIDFRNKKIHRCWQIQNRESP